jgi:hypothetical protein
MDGMPLNASGSVSPTANVVFRIEMRFAQWLSILAAGTVAVLFWNVESAIKTEADPSV